MAEHAGSGAVEREARHLVEAAARWLAAVPDEGAYAGAPVPEDHIGGASAGFDQSAEPFTAADRQAQLDEPEPDGSPHREQLCHGCPWCRAKAAVGPLGSDTLDSIAHLLGAAAESLSLFAQSRREAAQHDTASRYHHDDADSDEDQDAHPDDGPQDDADREGHHDKDTAPCR